MSILYMFCASFLIKYSVSIMQSVNIHIIKIVNKTCRCFIKILDLICTFSKLFFFFLNFSSFYLSFKIFYSFFFLVKWQTPSGEVVGARKRLHLPWCSESAAHHYVQQLCIF